MGLIEKVERATAGVRELKREVDSVGSPGSIAPPVGSAAGVGTLRKDLRRIERKIGRGNSDPFLGEALRVRGPRLAK